MDFAEQCSYAILQLRTLYSLAVRSCSITNEHCSAKIHTQAPPQIVDELARAVLASYFSHN